MYASSVSTRIGGLASRRPLRALVLASMLASLAAATGPTSSTPTLRIEPGPAVLRADFPDPFVLPVAGGYLAYATNRDAGAVNVQMAFSTDLKTWQLGTRDAMPTLPPWARRGFTWAPEVIAAGGGYVLYFTARHAKHDRQCVGAATSARAVGPFVPQGGEPLACQRELGGTIDASPFRDADGALYLYFKNDGNHPSQRGATRIYGQRLTPDGLGLAGEAAALLRDDAKWEGRVIEAPSMLRHGGGYRMLYSANDYGWPERARYSPYAIGYAICDGPLGPCRDAPGNPVLASQPDGPAGCLSGPGHQTVFEAEGAVMVAFHAWDATAACRPATRRRFMHIGRIGGGG